MRKDANAYEVSALLYLGALDGRLKADGEALKKRLKDIPDAWRQYRIAQVATEKALGALYDSLPEKTLRHLDRVLKNSVIQIKPKGITPPKSSVIVDEDILCLLINETMASRCAICLASPAEERACPIRKALTVIAAPDEYPNNGRCPYAEVTKQHELGGYI